MGEKHGIADVCERKGSGGDPRYASRDASRLWCVIGTGGVGQRGPARRYAPPLLLRHQHQQRWAARLKHLMRSLLHSQPRFLGRLLTLTCQVQLKVWGSLPETAQNLMMAGSSYSLPLDGQIPESLRSKIWTGDFVDLSLLLKPTHVQHQDYTMSVNSGATQPTFCVSPAKPKTEPLSFERWVQAFQLYMSVYLLAPANALLAVKMLKYMEVIRHLAEQGGNWLSYARYLDHCDVLEGGHGIT